MKTFTIEQARTAAFSGGVISANLKPMGSMFILEFETRNGTAVLIAAVSKQVRRFGNPVKAFEIVRALGLEGGHFSVAEWQPQARESDRPSRPDKAVMLKEAHEAAALKKLLEERIRMADSPDAVWLDAEDVFAEIEARNAN